MVLDVEFEGDFITVEFDYTPGEKEITYFGDGSGYPGCPPDVNIRKVTGNEWQLTESEIEDLVLEQMEEF